LNREGISAPRGGCWNASTIGGSRTRQNGILQNRLYIGQTVWNRQSFIKNPENGRRASRPNPPSDWMESKTPELRIIDDATWNAVQHRRAKRGGATRHHASRPRRLLSGLLKCGKCGSGYVVSGADKRGPYLRCSRLLESGACDNKRTVSLDAVEATVLHGIEGHLCAPDLVAEYVKEFHRAMADLRDTSQRRRAELSKRLVEVEKAINAIVDAIAEGSRSSRALTQRLADLESERDGIETTIKEAAPPPIALRPHATETYREKVKDLKAALNAADPENRTMAYEAIRELIDEVVIRPHGPYKPVEIDIYGRIQSLFPKNETNPESMGGVGCGGAQPPLPNRLTLSAAVTLFMRRNATPGLSCHKGTQPLLATMSAFGGIAAKRSQCATFYNIISMLRECASRNFRSGSDREARRCVLMSAAEAASRE